MSPTTRLFRKKRDRRRSPSCLTFLHVPDDEQCEFSRVGDSDGEFGGSGQFEDTDCDRCERYWAGDADYEFEEPEQSEDTDGEERERYLSRIEDRESDETMEPYSP